jgi:hypothetical protein
MSQGSVSCPFGLHTSPKYLCTGGPLAAAVIVVHR